MRIFLLAVGTALVLLLVAATAESGTALVAKSNDGLQCQPGSEVALDEMAAELVGAQIAVLASSVQNDGKHRIMQCGSGKGDFNVYEIPANDLKDALALGFEDVTDGFAR